MTPLISTKSGSPKLSKREYASISSAFQPLTKVSRYTVLWALSFNALSESYKTKVHNLRRKVTCHLNKSSLFAKTVIKPLVIDGLFQPLFLNK